MAPDDVGPRPDLELAQTFAEVARALLAEPTHQATLDKICTLARDTVEGCHHAALSLVQGRRIETTAATDDVPRRVDSIQYETDEGPCLDAIRDQAVLLADDLADEERWPAFAQRAAEETGVHSMLSFRLFAEEETFGALNLYAGEPNAFDDEAREVGVVFAAHAAVAMVEARRQEQFDDALASRDVIGQAKGILMARQGVTEEEAFGILRRASQRENEKLRAIAEQIAARPTEPPEA